MEGIFKYPQMIEIFNPANKIRKLFNIDLPIIQAGMVWCSGWKLASEVSNNGGLGLIGAGSMYPEVLEEHILKCKKATQKPFGVNVPLLYPQIEEIIDVIKENKVPIVFTSAGNPATWTSTLREVGIKVVHVISSEKFALKAQAAGVDAVVAEGFEAGGHNGREETTTFCLIPAVREAVDIPVIAAGGIGSGRAILSAMALGADGVQIGSLFAASEESSAHIEYKKRIIQMGEGETVLTLKQLAPVRMIKNKFYQQVMQAELQGASKEELKNILGVRRSKRGIFEGDMDEGELEIGQIARSINEIKPASMIIEELVSDFLDAKKSISQF